MFCSTQLSIILFRNLAFILHIALPQDAFVKNIIKKIKTMYDILKICKITLGYQYVNI